MTVVGRDTRSWLVLLGAGALLLAVAMWEAGLSAEAGQYAQGDLAGIDLLDASDAALDGDTNIDPACPLRHAAAVVPLPVLLPRALLYPVLVRAIAPQSVVAVGEPLRTAPKTSPPLRV